MIRPAAIAVQLSVGLLSLVVCSINAQHNCTMQIFFGNDNEIRVLVADTKIERSMQFNWFMPNGTKIDGVDPYTIESKKIAEIADFSKLSIKHLSLALAGNYTVNLTATYANSAVPCKDEMKVRFPGLKAAAGQLMSTEKDPVPNNCPELNIVKMYAEKTIQCLWVFDTSNPHIEWFDSHNVPIKNDSVYRIIAPEQDQFNVKEWKTSLVVLDADKADITFKVRPTPGCDLQTIDFRLTADKVLTDRVVPEISTHDSSTSEMSTDSSSLDTSTDESHRTELTESTTSVGSTDDLQFLLDVSDSPQDSTTSEFPWEFPTDSSTFDSSTDETPTMSTELSSSSSVDVSTVASQSASSIKDSSTSPWYSSSSDVTTDTTESTSQTDPIPSKSMSQSEPIPSETTTDKGASTSPSTEPSISTKTATDENQSTSRAAEETTLRSQTETTTDKGASTSPPTEPSIPTKIATDESQSTSPTDPIPFTFDLSPRLSDLESEKTYQTDPGPLDSTPSASAAEETTLRSQTEAINPQTDVSDSRSWTTEISPQSQTDSSVTESKIDVPQATMFPMEIISANKSQLSVYIPTDNCNKNDTDHPTRQTLITWTAPNAMEITDGDIYHISTIDLAKWNYGLISSLQLAQPALAVRGNYTVHLTHTMTVDGTNRHVNFTSTLQVQLPPKEDRERDWNDEKAKKSLTDSLTGAEGPCDLQIITRNRNELNVYTDFRNGQSARFKWFTPSGRQIHNDQLYTINQTDVTRLGLGLFSKLIVADRTLAETGSYTVEFTGGSSADSTLRCDSTIEVEFPDELAIASENLSLASSTERSTQVSSTQEGSQTLPTDSSSLGSSTTETPSTSTESSSSLGSTEAPLASSTQSGSEDSSTSATSNEGSQTLPTDSSSVGSSTTETPSTSTMESSSSLGSTEAPLASSTQSGSEDSSSVGSSTTETPSTSTTESRSSVGSTEDPEIPSITSSAQDSSTSGTPNDKSQRFPTDSSSAAISTTVTPSESSTQDSRTSETFNEGSQRLSTDSTSVDTSTSETPAKSTESSSSVRPTDDPQTTATESSRTDSTTFETNSEGSQTDSSSKTPSTSTESSTFSSVDTSTSASPTVSSSTSSDNDSINVAANSSCPELKVSRIENHKVMCIFAGSNLHRPPTIEWFNAHGIKLQSRDAYLITEPMQIDPHIWLAMLELRNHSAVDIAPYTVQLTTDSCQLVRTDFHFQENTSNGTTNGTAAVQPRPAVNCPVLVPYSTGNNQITCIIGVTRPDQPVQLQWFDSAGHQLQTGDTYSITEPKLYKHDAPLWMATFARLNQTVRDKELYTVRLASTCKGHADAKFQFTQNTANDTASVPKICPNVSPSNDRVFEKSGSSLAAAATGTDGTNSSTFWTKLVLGVAGGVLVAMVVGGFLVLAVFSGTSMAARSMGQTWRPSEVAV